MSVIDQARNAAEFIEDRTHEQHLDQLLWMMRTRRDEAVSRVPEWEQLRDLASQIKEHTLSNLAHYLEMFESRAKANGVTVHWAQDAAEHNQIVYQILSDRKVDSLIKSKSMLTEECDTRRFLENRGVRVTETDLGERIQQLDDQQKRSSASIPSGFSRTDIMILLDPAEIVENIHDAYGHPHFLNKAYSLLMSGPSGSADIGGITVHPAQGVMTLTVIFWPRTNKPNGAKLLS